LQAARLARAEATIDKYQKKLDEMMPLKKQNAEYLDKMDKYVDQIYELESANKSLNKMIEQYRDKNVELEREKYEALSSQQMQAFEVNRLTSDLDAASDAKRFLEEELASVREELQNLSEANAAREAANATTAGPLLFDKFR
jgi:chromosome segregation ATPase